MRVNKQTDETTKAAPKAKAERKPKAAPKAEPKAAKPAPGKLTDEERAQVRAWAHEELNRLVPATRPCGCGCGLQVSGRFAPGHDAKLVSRLVEEETARRLAKAQVA